MSNYKTTLQSNNTDLQGILNTINELPEAVEQATPIISVSSNGLITATAGAKTSTHQLAFQAAKTITPSAASQIAVSSGYYTGGDITVSAVPTQTKTATPTTTTQNITPDSGKFLSKVTINAIPSTYVQPNGTLNVTTNGIHNVKNYASVSVSVASGGDTSAEDGIISRTISGAYTNDRVNKIGGGAFAYCSSLTAANFPAATIIGVSAFYSCSKLTTASFPKATGIGGGAFAYCLSLTTASFPAATSIGSSAFAYCSSLTTASFPKATGIGISAFYSCSKLTTASFPAATSIGNSAFAYCSSLTTASFPAATKIGVSAFYSCSKLTTASFPKATGIGGGAFAYCLSLTTASFPKVTSIVGSSAFYRCYNLKSLYLTGSSVCTLSASNTFSSTPIGGYSTSAGTYGKIYVPTSLLTSYKTATNWTYFSSRFVGI